MAFVPARSRRVLSALAVVAVALPIVSSATSRTALTVSAPAVAPVAERLDARLADEHRYSDPVWYPLREAAWTSCSRTNCEKGGHPYHGNWAQDWTAMAFGDPVYAAGAGQVHIDRNVLECAASGGESTGTILSIDHGGGVFSVYKHLDIDVVEGQWVTPTTQIGRTAGWGSRNCGLPYLHFEIHHGGRGGESVPFNDLQACRSGDLRIWPDDLKPYQRSQPYETWDQVTPYFMIAKDERWDYRIYSSDNSCIPAVNATPSRPSGLVGSYSLDSISVTWAAPSESVDETVARLQLYRPTTNEWAILEHVVLDPSTTSVTFPGLDTGRSYRVRLAHRNGVGSSEWSRDVQLIPGTAPRAPVAPAKLVSTRTTISYSWERPLKYGYSPTGFVVQIRSLRKGVWSTWVSTRKDVSQIYNRWEGLVPDGTYQLRVRATSGAGPSPWSTITTVSTKP